MRNLLNKSINRRLVLVEITSKSNSWLQLDKLAKIMKCSQKTILSDVEYINDFWGDFVHIDYSKNNGLHTYAVQSNKINNVYKFILQTSSEFNFLEQIFFDPNQDAEYWMNHLYISEPSFYRMVACIEKALKKRGLTLERKPFRVVAEDERWVRLFYQSYFIEAYGSTGWPFELHRESLLCFVMRISTDYDILLDDRELIEHAYLMMISVIRVHQGFILNEQLYDEPDNILDQLIKNSEDYAQNLANSSSYHPLVPKWYKELSQTVFYEFFNWSSEQQEIRISESIHQFLEKMTKVVGIPIDDQDEKKIIQRMLNWYTAANVYPYPRTMLHSKNEIFADSIRRIYPIYSRLVPANLKDIEKTSGFQWVEYLEDEIICLLLKEWTNLPKQLESLRRRVSLLVVSDLGYKHSHMLKEIIKAQYYDRIEIAVYHGSTLFLTPEELAAFKEYDILVTNNPIVGYNHDNIMITDNYFSEADWDELSRKIVTLQKVRSEMYLAELDLDALRSGNDIYAPQRRSKISTIVMDQREEYDMSGIDSI